MSSYQRTNYSEIRSLDEAIERLRQVEDAAGMSFETHPRYGFTAQEQVLLGILASTPQITTKEHAYTLMYGMHDDPPEQKILDVYLCKLRRKLAIHEINIITVWGRGWFMEPEDRAKVDLLRFRVAA